MKKLLVSFLAILAAMSLAGCWDINNVDPENIAFETVEIEQVGLQIDKPEGWYQTGDNLEEQGVYVFAVPNQYSADDKMEGRFRIEVIPLVEGGTLEGTYQNMEDLANSSDFTDYKLVSRDKNVTIMNKDGKELAYTYTSEFQDSKLEGMTTQAIVVGDKAAYWISYNDEVTDHEKYADVLKRLYSNMKEL